MDQEIGLVHAALAERHHLQREGAGREPESLVPLPSEDQRLAVLQEDLRLGRVLALGEGVERAVVVNDAVLEDLEERGPLVRVRRLENVGEPLLVGIDGTGDEARPGAEGKAGRGKGVVD